MLCKKHVPLCLMCVGGCLSYSAVLYVTLVVITMLRVSTPELSDTIQNNGHFVLR